MQSISLSEFYRRIPKIDLHYHLLGGVRIATMRAFAAKYQVPLSEDDAKAYYRAHQLPGMEKKGGIAALNFLYQIMQKGEDYRQVILEIAEDANACGLRYIETFWNPSDTKIPYGELNSTLVQAIEQAEQDFQVRIRLIPSINREKSPEEAVRMVEKVIAHPHPFILGIGIDYKEHDAPVEKFWKAYRLAKHNGLKLTAHCSEFGLHWRNVETGIELIGCDRIDHGYSILDNEPLTARYARQGVPFTVIPSNTYFLSLWPDHATWCENHPIRAMAKAGLNIIACTDDWHIHATDSANCCRVLIEELGFDLDGLRLMLQNAIAAAWVNDEIKNRWQQHWLAEYDLLRAQLADEPIHNNPIRYQRPISEEQA